jgi:hypothetical protein
MTIPGRGTFLAIAVPVVLLGGVLVFAAYGWLQEHDARVNAQTQTGQQQKQIDLLQRRQVETQQALDNKLTAIEQQRKQPATAPELVSDTASLLPSLPEALQVRTVPENPGLPDAPATQEVVVPAADFKTIRDAQLTCEEDSAKLAACQNDRQETDQELKLAESQRDEWKTAAKGGSLWHRALGAAKWFAVGAGTGAAAYAVAHHR